MNTRGWGIGILAANEDHNHDTDGMIALLPRDPQQWAVPGGDPPEELHVTVQYFADAAALDPTRVMQVLDEITGMFSAIQARVMGHATFNPDGGAAQDKDPCAVYLVSDSPDLAELADAIQTELPSPEAHHPYLPHLTAGYGLVAAQLQATGPIVFDRIRLALADQVTDFPLKNNSLAIAL